MSGIGENYPTYEPLRKALEAHAKELYGDEYVLQDFVAIAYVVSMGDDAPEELAEYVLVTSTRVNHIIEGLLAQSKLFDPSHVHDADDQ